MEQWVLGKWGHGFIGKIPLDMRGHNTKMQEISFEHQHSIIPPFHYSMNEAETQASKKPIYYQ